MCLTIYRKNDREIKPKTARKNIIVYKQLSFFNNRPLYNRLLVNGIYEDYEIGYTYTEDNPFEIINYDCTPAISYTEIKGRCFHSFSKKIGNGANAKFMIPKGAKYYYSKGFYASDKIKFIKRYK